MAARKGTRSPRFSVPNDEGVVVSIGTEKLTGTLHLLSLTGGAVRLPKRAVAGTLGDIAFSTVTGTFSAAIEFLQTAGSKPQGFRFIAMSATASKRLQDALKKMRSQGLAVNKTPLDHVRDLARRVLPRRSR